jgi:biopolymer transport protein ExbD
MAEVAAGGKAPAPKQGEIKIKKPRRREGVRIDMTPMVDVAFLLLIFFMVTTVFRQPLAMEVNMPEPGAQVKVPEDNVMTVFVDREDELHVKAGTGTIASLGWEALFGTIREGVQRNPALIVLVKIHREANYESMVEMMDTLEDAQMDRFSVIPMSEEDAALLEKAR